MLSGTVLDLQYILCDCLSSEVVVNVNMLHMGMELVVLGYCNGLLIITIKEHEMR